MRFSTSLYSENVSGGTGLRRLKNKVFHVCGELGCGSKRFQSYFVAELFNPARPSLGRLFRIASSIVIVRAQVLVLRSGVKHVPYCLEDAASDCHHRPFISTSARQSNELRAQIGSFGASCGLS